MNPAMPKKCESLQLWIGLVTGIDVGELTTSGL